MYFVCKAVDMTPNVSAAYGVGNFLFLNLMLDPLIFYVFQPVSMTGVTKAIVYAILSVG